MLNILYLISCFGHGRGGHFYSLRTTAEEMSKIANVSIISVGTYSSPVFEGKRNYSAIKTNLPSISVFSRILKRIHDQRINVIHSFDVSAYLFARIASILSGVPVLQTKPGGESPKFRYPKVEDLVLFSTEDMRYFEKSPNHQKTKLYHIPNRISGIAPDLLAIQNIRQHLRNTAKVIFRIARFGEQHKKSISSSIELVKRLRNDNIDVQLLLVGAIQEKHVYEELLSEKTEDILFVTDNRFTVNASRIIDVADMVVGTGRGAMEAAVQEKVVLSPVSNLPIPILVTENNIEKFLDFNFSNRTQIHSLSCEVEYEKIRTALLHDELLKRLSSFTTDYAKSHFEISNVQEQYKNLYFSCQKCTFYFIDLIYHYYLVARNFWTHRAI